MTKKRFNFRLSSKAVKILDSLARQHGLSRTAALEMILREFEERTEIRLGPGVGEFAFAKNKT